LITSIAKESVFKDNNDSISFFPILYLYNRENSLLQYFFNHAIIEQGTLKNGNVVAVKKLVLGKSSKIDNDFESEVKLISNVHHRNLVRLLGCCSKNQERILVYEYMANSSLDKFLFGNNSLQFNH